MHLGDISWRIELEEQAEQTYNIEQCFASTCDIKRSSFTHSPSDWQIDTFPSLCREPRIGRVKVWLLHRAYYLNHKRRGVMLHVQVQRCYEIERCVLSHVAIYSIPNFAARPAQRVYSGETDRKVDR